MKGENEPAIFTYGDSHCWHGWKSIPNTTFIYGGPMTMHSFGTSRPEIPPVPEGATMCFCFGEIDCRCHVNKHPPAEKTISELVEAYLSMIRMNVSLYKRIWIYNVVPPVRKDFIVENPNFPFNGTDEERLNYVRSMNHKLLRSEFPIVDVYDKYADKDGFLRMELSDGDVHIRDERYLLEWVNEHR